MSNQTFQFKQFTIDQERCAMKVGTDGVLLGAWAPMLSARHILDIGTGSGLIAIMAAQRNATAMIDAIELDADAAAQAVANVKACPWSDRISVRETSIQAFAATTSETATATDRYDLIVSNPPFFEESLKPDDKARAAARHTDALPFPVLIDCADRLLSADGMLALIYPATADRQLQTAAVLHHLHCACLCEVKTLPHKPVKRLMALFTRSIPDYVFRRETLTLYDAPGIYSQDYLRLTADFYLHL